MSHFRDESTVAAAKRAGYAPIHLPNMIETRLPILLEDSDDEDDENTPLNLSQQHSSSCMAVYGRLLLSWVSSVCCMR